MMKQTFKGIFGAITPVTFFVTLATIFGIAFLYIFPPMSAPDEIGHFAKAYAFAEGKIIPSYKNVETNSRKSWDKYGFYLPDDINDMNEDSIGVVLDANLHYNYKTLEGEKYKTAVEEFTGLGGQLNYSFIQYIPQILGVLISKIFTSSAVTSYYFAKIANFIVYIVLVALAIRLFRFSKWAVAMLGLNPMFLELATSASGDSFTNAVSFVFIALLSRFIVDEKKIEFSQLLVSFVLFIALVQMKATTIAFGLLYFAIPNKKFSIKDKAIYGTIVLVLSVGLYVLWGKLFPTQQEMYIDFTDGKAQVQSILRDPLNFLTIIKNTIVTKTGFLLKSYSGQFSALNRNLPFAAVGLYYVLSLIVSFSRDDKKKYSSILQKLNYSVLMLGFVLLTFVALYQIWTPVGSTEIIGLQGRYFIPLTLVALMLCHSKRQVLSESVAKVLSITTMVILLSYTTIFLMGSYGII